jgi:four helix bundle protein
MDLSRFELIGEADQISDIVWREVMEWNYFLKDTIGKQLVRSIDSISANLSEAYGRYTVPERIRFTYYSRGSLCESINWLQKTKRRNLISEEIADKLICSLDQLSRRQNAYINSLKKMK